MNRPAVGPLALLVCLGIPTVLAAAQSHALAPPVGGITLEQVIQLSRAGLSDTTIIAQIKKRSQPFNLSPNELLELKAANVSNAVIESMTEAKDRVVTVLGAAPSPEAAVPSEIGVYARNREKWVEVIPDVVNWKTGGVVKSVATAGIVRGDINGHINGANSRNRFATPIEFLIVLPEGIAISEYQLLHLHEHADGREFRTVTGGVFHVSGGATRDLLRFDWQKIASRAYTVTLPSGFAEGEYGFLPPGAGASWNAASQGKVYSFRITD